MKLTPQIVEGIDRLLIGGRRIVGQNNMLCFGATKEALHQAYLDWDNHKHSHFVKSKSNRKQTEILEKDGVYKYPFWQKKAINPESVNSGLGSKEQPFHKAGP